MTKEEVKNMSKYTKLHFCSCGTVHELDDEVISQAIMERKDVLYICARCGNAVLFGGDIVHDFDNPGTKCIDFYAKNYSMYKDAIITADTFKEENIYKIIYSRGHKIPMMTGNYANSQSGGVFSDTVYPDFYKIQRKDVTVEEIMHFINEFNINRHKINMNRLINENSKEFVDIFKGYY